MATLVGLKQSGIDELKGFLRRDAEMSEDSYRYTSAAFEDSDTGYGSELPRTKRASLSSDVKRKVRELLSLGGTTQTQKRKQRAAVVNLLFAERSDVETVLLDKADIPMPQKFDKRKVPSLPPSPCSVFARHSCRANANSLVLLLHALMWAMRMRLIWQVLLVRPASTVKVEELDPDEGFFVPLVEAGDYVNFEMGAQAGAPVVLSLIHI